MEYLWTLRFEDPSLSDQLTMARDQESDRVVTTTKTEKFCEVICNLCFLPRIGLFIQVPHL
jgi:hypothetical protein